MSKISELIFSNEKHYITSPFGYRTLNGKNSLHQGVDYGTSNQKLPQYAIERGYVFACDKATADKALYVWVVYPRIKKAFLHYHLDKYSVLATQDVQRGTLIGYTGKTGYATGIHLHLGVRDLSVLSESQIKNISWSALRSCPYIDAEKINYSDNPYKEPNYVVNRRHHEFGKIRIGNEGVKWVQWELHRLGYYNANIDGYFGAITEQSVKAFQTKQRLEVDGSVFTKTISALKSV